MNPQQGIYKESHCYQYNIRLNNLESDLKEAGITKDEAARLRVSDFRFEFVPKENKNECRRIAEFIERHEWLGKMPHRPTHRFVGTYQGRLAGVVVMATPNAFSSLLGKEDQGLEKLIARGACISWSPKNLASSLIMFSVRWMVRNTAFRVFTAYSDTEARELGTIYQACNFTYLGSGFGARVECFDPNRPERRWFSDRTFRKPDQYRYYADRLGLLWKREWGERGRINWAAIPEPVCQQLKDQAREAEDKCEKREVPKKHKYAYILGQTKSETRRLRSKFASLHPELVNLPYPKLRGPLGSKAESQAIDLAVNLGTQILATQRPTNLAAADVEIQPEISDGHLMLQKFERRPHGREGHVDLPQSPMRQVAASGDRFVSIKEIASRYRVSDWTLYRFIKTDPTFPYLNVGLKKKFVIDEGAFRIWMEQRTRRERSRHFRIPSGEDLLQRRTG
jgi:hypothetical protein